MASKRLTESARSTITNRFVERAFQEEQGKLDRAWINLGAAAYHGLVPRSLSDKLTSLPDLFALYKQELPIVIYGSGEPGTRSKERTYLPLPNSRPVPVSGIPEYGSDHWVTEQVLETRRWKQDLRQRQDRMKREVYGVLKAFNTTNQLLKHWPEIEPFLPDSMADDQPKNLPAADLRNLRQMTSELLEKDAADG